MLGVDSSEFLTFENFFLLFLWQRSRRSCTSYQGTQREILEPKLNSKLNPKLDPELRRERKAGLCSLMTGLVAYV